MCAGVYLQEQPRSTKLSVFIHVELLYKYYICVYQMGSNSEVAPILNSKLKGYRSTHVSILPANNTNSRIHIIIFCLYISSCETLSSF
jgi:hypothetical protein